VTTRRVGGLRPGEGFRTTLTGREGVILDVQDGRWRSIAVFMSNPEEEKALHPDVRVIPLVRQ